MNHSGDANKMVSETPRTDAAYFKPGATMYDMAGEMKRMERELTAANDRIKRLEENIESLKVWGNELYCEVYAPAPNCSCHISPPCSDCLEHSNIREIKAGWKAAKEAKP